MKIKNETIFGIINSNRKNTDLWGKNQFNSAFPVGLANYMWSKKINCDYIYFKNKEVAIKKLTIGELFGAPSKKPEDLYFAFESVFSPYNIYVRNKESLDGIDLVVKDNETQKFLRPLEVKLTVMPDNTTASCENQEDWGSELVIRPATMEYCAIGMIHNLQNHLEELQGIFNEDCDDVEDWTNEKEIIHHIPKFLSMAQTFVTRFYSHQQPLVMQPVWKTQGKNPSLCDKCFHIYVWSDYAFTQLFLNPVKEQIEKIKIQQELSRPGRCLVRFVRTLYELCNRRKISIDLIYRKTAYGKQSDKEFAVSGSKTNQYFRLSDLRNFPIGKDELFEIILNGGEKLLSPERRFDQTVYFTMREK